MKIKTSMKVCYNFKKVFRCGYCDLYYTFLHYAPTYYNAGVYGWNNDLYIDYKRDIIVTTGYRNMRGDRIPSDIIQKYETLAKETSKKQMSFDDTIEAFNEIVEAFFEDLNNL